VGLAHYEILSDYRWRIRSSLPLLLMCPTGARAQRGVAILTKRGHERVNAVTGGVAAWREANLPIERST
jgi:rhodanese-related sulfurtransferase